MDPTEERRHSKKQKEEYNMLGFVADSQFGIPRSCPCGGRIINEVQGKEEYDSLPGKRFFTCVNYEDDGFHYRHPWVIGVQQETEILIKWMDEAEKLIKGVCNLKIQILKLKEQVKTPSGQVDCLTVQVADLEKVSFE